MCKTFSHNFFTYKPIKRSIKACKPCGYGKKYNEANTPWTCECDTTLGFTKAGSTCILSTDASSLNIDSTVYSISYKLEVKRTL